MKQGPGDKTVKAKETVTTLFSLMPSSLYLQTRWRYHKHLQPKEVVEREQELRTVITNEGTSLKPFDDTRTIFVHIPKCAGTSVSKALFGNFSGGHLTFDEYLNHFEPGCIASYFKFTFVRNPWDRVVSCYHYLKDGGSREGDRLWFSTELAPLKDFEQFVKRWLNKENIWTKQAFTPQYHYIVERRNKAQVDFVGYLENLEEDFEHIRTRMGLDCHLQHVNKSKHHDYRDYYNEETKAIVAEAYETDIKLLGYNFDNSSLPAQLARRSMGGALDFISSGLRGGTGRIP
jgi:hypothetical protein